MLSNEPFFLSNKTEHACLLLHGLGGGVYEMRSLGEYLYQAGYTVQGINYPGHGEDMVKMPPSNWEQWYEAIEQNYQALARNYASICVIGFSTGSPLALYLACNYSFNSLVLLSPFLAIKKPWYSPFKPEFLLSMFKDILKEVPRVKSNDLPFLGYSTFNLHAVSSAVELISIVRGRLAEVTPHTLIIQSPCDTVVEPNEAIFLYENLASSHKQLIWLEKSGHNITLDVEKEKVFQHIKNFLAEQL